MPTIALGGGLTGDGSAGSPLRVASPLIAFSANASDPALLAAGYVQTGTFYSSTDYSQRIWASVPNGTAHAGRAVIGTTLYLVGGYTTPGTVTNRLLSLDLSNSQSAWATKASMPTARAGAAVVASGGKIYVIGGTTTGISGTPPGTSVAIHEVYDPTTDTWSTAASLPQFNGVEGAAGRAFSACAIGSGLIHIAGGILANSQVSQAYLTYNIANNAWNLVHPFFIQARFGLTGAVIETGVPFPYFVVTGGRDPSGNARSETFWVNFASGMAMGQGASLPAATDYPASFVDATGAWHVLGFSHFTMNANATAWSGATPPVPFDIRGGVVAPTPGGTPLFVRGGTFSASGSGASVQMYTLPTIYRYQLVP